MSHLRQSLSWWCYENRGLATDELLATAAKIGYEGVDLVPEALWGDVVRQGLSVVAVMGHASIDDGLNRRENAARIEAELRANIAKAEQWKIPVLICFSGNRYEQTDEEGAKLSAETLARVAPAAADAGVVLAIELLNSKVDHIGYQCDRTAWGIEVCRQAGSPAVKLLYDIYHMQIMEGDIIRTIQNDHAYFAHYHTAGNPGRGFPGASQEINYPAIYKAIAATGYQGFVGHEFIPGSDVAGELKQAHQDCAGAVA
ncbi:MAG: TIM barrel protein [Chthoniobacteraceae bacterium]